MKWKKEEGWGEGDRERGERGEEGGGRKRQLIFTGFYYVLVILFL